MMMMMGHTVSHKAASSGGFDLMQNCDLPPPSKVFKGSDKKMLLDLMSSIGFVDCRNGGGGDGNSSTDVLEILKALRSSQTRAREAESRAAILIRQRDCLSNALMEEAMRLYAYRQQVRLLELHVSNLRRKRLSGFDCEPQGFNEEDEDEEDGEERVSLVWLLALAFSWGIGVGAAIVCRYFL